jgi:hypothetical protein
VHAAAAPAASFAPDHPRITQQSHDAERQPVVGLSAVRTPRLVRRLDATIWFSWFQPDFACGLGVHPVVRFGVEDGGCCRFRSEKVVKDQNQSIAMTDSV